MLSTRLLQNIVLGLVLAIFIVGVILAMVMGSNSGKSIIVLKNVQTISTGLDYFLKDQNRYPTAVEFQDRNIMENYFSAFPPQNIAGGSCGQSYNYINNTAKTYALNFCLPTSSSGFSSGWNKLVSH